MSLARLAIAVACLVLPGCLRGDYGGGLSFSRDDSVRADSPVPGTESQPLPAADDLVAEIVTGGMRDSLENPEDEDRDLYVRLLTNADADIRLKALRALEFVDLNDEVSAAIVARTLDHDARVRRLAAEQIWYFDIITPKSLDALERLITDRNPSVREEAITTVGSLGLGDDGKRMIPALMKVIAAQGECTLVAIDTLAEIGPPPEAAPLLQAAFEEHGESALYAMSEIEEPQLEMLPWLRKIMASDDDFDRQMAAAWTLGRFGDTRLLIKAAKSSNELERELGMEGLGGVRNQSEEVADLIVVGLQDRDANVRERAAEAIGYAEAPSDLMVLSLMRTFADPDSYVRDTAREALDQLVTEERLDSEFVGKIDAELAKSPKDKGLILAKAALIYPLAYIQLSSDDDADAKTFELFHSAGGQLLEVLPPGFKLSEDESDVIGSFLYDAACSAARLDKLDLSMKYLTAAVENGWDDLDWLQDDSDLDPLRERDDYQSLMKQYVD